MLSGSTVIADGTMLIGPTTQADFDPTIHAQIVWFSGSIGSGGNNSSGSGSGSGRSSGSNNNSSSTTNNSSSCNNNVPKLFSHSFGWAIGFRRSPTMAILAGSSGNTGTAPVDIYGPKFLVLVINDYNHNQINDPLVCMTDSESLWSAVDCHSLVPTAPRTKTQAQIYSANEIAKQRKNTQQSNRPIPPLCANMFAILPIKRNINAFIGDVITEVGGNLKDYERTFFGPVDITKMQVKLIDDRGRTVNLNTTDWCVTLLVECLYKY
jgi:hypothetical protein